jgi:GNAT superfamily N-acetyltransferase
MESSDVRTDRLRWVKDDDPRWDADRERVFAGLGADVFPGVVRQEGKHLASDWWRVEDGERVVGYGWLDDVWGDAEILLVVEERARGGGAGAFALAHLEGEAAARGLNYGSSGTGSPAPTTAGSTSRSVTRSATSASTSVAAPGPAGPSRRTTGAGRGMPPSATGRRSGRAPRRSRPGPISGPGARRVAGMSTRSGTGTERGDAPAVAGRGGVSR